MVYYNKKNNKNNKNKNKVSRKQNPSELLNSKKTKKALILSNILKGGKKNKQENKVVYNNVESIVESNIESNVETNIESNVEVESNSGINNIESNVEVESNSGINNIESSNLNENQTGGGLFGTKWSNKKAIENILKKCNEYKTKLETIYLPKLKIILNILNDEESLTGIKYIHQMINHILELESKLNHFNKLGQTVELAQSTRESLKPIYNYYPGGFFERSLLKDSKYKNNIPLMINTLQDRIRLKLMNEINFNKVDSLLKFNRNTVIGLLYQYRFIESKYNKYNQKFFVQYLAFINTVKQDCDKLKDYSDKLESTLEYDISKKTGRKQIEFADLTLCENYETVEKSLSETLKTLTDESVKSLGDIQYKWYHLPGKNKDKAKLAQKLKQQKAKSESFKKLNEKATGDFNKIFEYFIKTRTDFQKVFLAFEKEGLNSYPSNVPDKHTKDLKAQIKTLSRNQTFIKDFTNMIMPLKNEADELYQSLYKDLFHNDVFETDFIPQITFKEINNPQPVIVNIDMDLYENNTNEESNITYYREAIEKEIDNIRNTVIKTGANGELVDFFRRNTKNIINLTLDSIYKDKLIGSASILKTQLETNFNVAVLNTVTLLNDVDAPSTAFNIDIGDIAKYTTDADSTLKPSTNANPDAQTYGGARGLGGSVDQAIIAANAITTIVSPYLVKATNTVNNALLVIPQTLTNYETHVLNAIADPAVRLATTPIITNYSNKITTYFNDLIKAMFMYPSIKYYDTGNNLVIKKDVGFIHNIERADIICIQNISKAKMDIIEKKPDFNVVVVKVNNHGIIDRAEINRINTTHTFIAIAKSGCGTLEDKNSNTYSNYNIICVKKDAFNYDDIEKFEGSPTQIKIRDQSM